MEILGMSYDRPPSPTCNVAHPVLTGVRCTDTQHPIGTVHNGAGISWGTSSCGKLHPKFEVRCGLEAHPANIPHSGSGITWIGQRADPVSPPVTELRQLSEEDPDIVDAFAFGMLAAGMIANGGSTNRARIVWDGLPLEDRARWQDKAAAAIHHALSYVPTR